MFGDDDVQRGLQLFRITVLGSANSGKTSLISSFVNNFCPTVYTPTGIIDSLLFYKTMDLVEVKCQQIRGEEHSLQEDLFGCEMRCMICGTAIRARERAWHCRAKNSCGCICSKCWLEQHEVQAFPVLVEIEDSYPSRSMNQDKYEATFLSMESRHHQRRMAQKTEGAHDPGTPSAASMDSQRFNPSDFLRQRSPSGFDNQSALDERSSPIIEELNSQDEEQLHAEVLRRFEPPVVGRHNPLAKRRMGFLIVYDCQDDQSFEEATEILERLMQHCRSAKKQPLVYLVANKQDMATGNHANDCTRIRSAAEDYVQTLRRLAPAGGENRVALEEISATELKKVKGLFRRMLISIKESDLVREKGMLGQSRKGSKEMFSPLASLVSSARSGTTSLSAEESSSDSDAEGKAQNGKQCEVQ